jgi:hypothetical protein
MQTPPLSGNRPSRHLWIVLALVVPAVVLGFAPTYLKGLTFSRLPGASSDAV